MVIFEGQERDYPRLHARLRQVETQVRQDPRLVGAILDLLLEAAGYEPATAGERTTIEAQLARALTYGEAPSIAVMDTLGACGGYLPGGNTLVLERSIARRYEDCATDPLNARFLEREVLARLLQALGHWLMARCAPHLSAPVWIPGALDALCAGKAARPR